MGNFSTEFRNIVESIISNGFQPEGIIKLDKYAEQFISGKLRFKRFLPYEQDGCSAGGPSHVIATILAGTETCTDSESEEIAPFKRIVKRAEAQVSVIEDWARKTGIWFDDVDNRMVSNFGSEIAEGGEAKVYDNGIKLIKTIGLDYFILPHLALDRISLHNAYFPATSMQVIGFGKDEFNDFKIIVEQTFIKGNRISEEKILELMEKMGFRLKNPINWTYYTPNIYLSDIHDENIIQSDTGSIFIIDCDIRLNTPDLKCGGSRVDTNEVFISEFQ